eukprot:TRINITY_DN3899_c0_g1_i1.p2 TRINITY_DN3899_c0_g1~~TRINITY_DN3899_c0_g1_i1.p2  ORF type:complete len:243 (-),score=13.02 TRINITY_DN3899_c0_g1_i1:15-677(-)
MVRFIFISDTHNGHQQLTTKLNQLYRGKSDVLVHCGDMTDRGSKHELENINQWFGQLPFQNIISIGGNMDGIGLEKFSFDEKSKILSNSTYLENESLELHGLKIYGSPCTPKFCGGFQLRGNQEAKQVWDQIPENTQILVTHGPPYGIMDVTSRGQSVGCPMLQRKLSELKDLKVAAWGHIHESYGSQFENNVWYINAAQYNGLNGSKSAIEPIVVDIEI